MSDKDLKFGVGDIVDDNGQEVKVLEIDESGKDMSLFGTPYFARLENGKEVWISLANATLKKKASS